MRSIIEARDRLIKHREDVRAKDEQKQVARYEGMRSDMLDLWNALSKTHPNGLYLTNSEIETTLPKELTEYLFSENGRQPVNYSLFFYTHEEGNLPLLVLGAVDQNFRLRSDNSLLVGLAFIVREGVLSLETRIGRKVSKETERKAQTIMKNIGTRSELLRYGEPMIKLAQLKYLEVVQSEVGPKRAGGVSGG